MNIPIEEKNKWKSGKYYKEIKVEFPEYELEIYNDGIYGESLNLIEALFDGNGALEVVGCISSRLSLELRYLDYGLKGLKIWVSVRIDGGPWRRIFTGWVDSVETARDRSYQKFECYDGLYLYSNKNVADVYKTTIPCTIKQLRDKMFSLTAIEQAPISLPNDDVMVVNEIDDNDMAWLDVIKAICQANGVFGIINREGKFEYRTPKKNDAKYNVPSARTFPGSRLLPGIIQNGSGEDVAAYKSIKFDNYKVRPITGVIVRDSNSDEEYGEYNNGGMIGKSKLLIEGNLCLVGLSKEEKDAVAKKIHKQVVDIEYRPFEAVNPGMPYIEVGDCINYYVYDYTKGKPKETLMSFNVLKRTLKGLQWLEDTFNADGDEVQPEIKVHDEGLTIGDVREEVRWKTNVEDNPPLKYEEGGKYSQEYVEKYNKGLLYDRETIDKKIDSSGGSGIANIVSIEQLPQKPARGVLFMAQGEVIVVARK